MLPMQLDLSDQQTNEETPRINGPDESREKGGSQEGEFCDCRIGKDRQQEPSCHGEAAGFLA